MDEDKLINDLANAALDFNTAVERLVKNTDLKVSLTTTYATRPREVGKRTYQIEQIEYDVTRSISSFMVS